MWQQQIPPNLALHCLSHAFIDTFHNKLAYSCIAGAMAPSKSVICSNPSDWYVIRYKNLHKLVNTFAAVQTGEGEGGKIFFFNLNTKYQNVNRHYSNMELILN